jgi:hypothetical protein
MHSHHQARASTLLCCPARRGRISVVRTRLDRATNRRSKPLPHRNRRNRW